MKESYSIKFKFIFVIQIPYDKTKCWLKSLNLTEFFIILLLWMLCVCVYIYRLKIRYLETWCGSRLVMVGCWEGRKRRLLHRNPSFVPHNAMTQWRAQHIQYINFDCHLCSRGFAVVLVPYIILIFNLNFLYKSLHLFL